ncbi:MAG TPA: hypothetical protein VHK88_07730 [Aquihabitans sp.]|nr:hypothetical protein [Aquihabitans sp.]
MADQVLEGSGGLRFDLSVMDRRRALTLLGGGAVALLVGCTSDAETGDAEAGTSSTAETSATVGRAEIFPEEMAGPYPADGSNGLNVLAEQGVVRQDIRSSFGSSDTTAEGVSLVIEINLLDSARGAPLAGAAVYLWQCDREARYSLYSEGVTGQNYLRGVQASDADGRVTFTSIFPAAYSGRWPHLHFEVYESLDAATGGGAPSATSQIALPEEACDSVYETAGYEQSKINMAQTPLEDDVLFGDDGAEQQMGTTTGNPSEGYVLIVSVPVDAA